MSELIKILFHNDLCRQPKTAEWTLKYQRKIPEEGTGCGYIMDLQKLLSVRM